MRAELESKLEGKFEKTFEKTFEHCGGRGRRWLSSHKFGDKFGDKFALETPETLSSALAPARGYQIAGSDEFQLVSSLRPWGRTVGNPSICKSLFRIVLLFIVYTY